MIPSFVKRSVDKYGLETRKYLEDTRTGMEKLSKEILPSMQIPERDKLILVKWDQEAEVKVLAAMLYPHSHLPMDVLIKLVETMDLEQRKKIISEYLSRRTNRRHKGGRALENASYTFDILANYGIFRDLHRHRMLTQEKQDLTTKHGFDIPKHLVDAGFQKEFVDAMQAAKNAFETISQKFPKQAQYVVPLGFKIRWYFNMTLREVFHLTELRSIQQGHADYRKIAQMIFLKVKEIHPALGEMIKFVDMNEYSLERLEAEKKIDQKMEELKKKYGT